MSRARKIIITLSGISAAILALFALSNLGKPAPKENVPPPGESERVETHIAPKSVASAVLDLEIDSSAPRLEITYPYDGAVFPPEFPPPTILWRLPELSVTPDGYAAGISATGVGVVTKRLTVALVDSTRWKPESVDWKKVKGSSVKEDAVINVRAYRLDANGRPEILAAGKVRIRTSTDPVGAPILYRDVPLPFIYAVKNPDTIRWRLVNPASDSLPPVVLENLPCCGNCHSASLNGKVLGMDVDYANDKGSYALASISKRIILSRDNLISWNDYRIEDGEDTFGLLARVSPTGKYAVCTVKDRSVFTPKSDSKFSQLFFPIKGILCVYDRVAKKFFALKGADDREFVQSNPAWTPDEKYIYFARSPDPHIKEADDQKKVLITSHLAREFLDGERGFQYEIWRVPFNGGSGGRPEPVKGASSNGMSNYFPKISPDGRWLVFCQAENFMLLQPDSALYIVSAGGGVPRRMRCNTELMNSWHSWSPNGRWLVFSSKVRGAYTQLFLAHVDENGEDSPPVMLEHSTQPGRAANIPEFINIPPDMRFQLKEAFLDDENFRRQADVVAEYGAPEDSLRFYRKALEMNPNNVRAHLHLAASYNDLGKPQKAEREFQIARRLLLAEKVTRYNHNRVLTDHRNIVQYLVGRRRYYEAIIHYNAIIELAPSDADAELGLGLAYARTEKREKAVEHFRKALELDPDNGPAHLAFGIALELDGHPEKAKKEYRAALAAAPRNELDGVMVLKMLITRPELHGETAAYIERLLNNFPDNFDLWVLEGKLALNSGDVSGAIKAFKSAEKLEPDKAWLAAKIKELENLRCSGK